MNTSDKREETLAGMFFNRVNKYSSKIALKFKKNNLWKGISWTEFGLYVQKIGCVLISLGIAKNDRVVILSENRPEWGFCDLAIISIGAVTVPIYATETPYNIEYILKDSGAKLIVASTDQQLDKVLKVKAATLKDIKIVILDTVVRYKGPRIYSLDELIEVSSKELTNIDMFWKRLDANIGDELATIIYTSGTTDLPKGVMLSHKNLLSNGICASQVIDITEKDIYLSFLPLSHIFERMAGFYTMLLKGATIAYAQSMHTVVDDMKEVEPTLVYAVPRFFEKIHDKIYENLIHSLPIKRFVFIWALNIARYVLQKKLSKKPISLLLKIRYALATLVFKRLKDMFGKRFRFFVSGGAPLSKELIEFFMAMDILILEGYGLTETSPVVTVNSPDKFKIGTVGKVIPQVKVDIAKDGEILVNGPNVMKGYFNRKDLTDEVLRDGWLHTGDMGYLDNEGFLTITDRKKDIIITAGGKNIAPTKIENMLRTDRFISEAIVYGDRKKYLVALIIPEFNSLSDYAKYKKIIYNNTQELLANTIITEFYQRRIFKCLKDLPSFEQIKYFRLLDKNLSLELGEITPTMKVRRQVIFGRYKDIFESMY